MRNRTDKIISRAISFFESKKYSYIEVPWIVSSSTITITQPASFPDILDDRSFVASGEQSFLQLIIDGKLKYGKYCCVTPCYRPLDNLNDGLHFETFSKVELINYINETSLSDDGSDHLQSLVDNITKDAKKFMERERHETLQIVSTTDEERRFCKTYFSRDIISKKFSIELGSYGYRTCAEVGSWVFGTGVAVPRITYKG